MLLAVYNPGFTMLQIRILTPRIVKRAKGMFSQAFCHIFGAWDVCETTPFWSHPPVTHTPPGQTHPMVTYPLLTQSPWSHPLSHTHPSSHTSLVTSPGYISPPPPPRTREYGKCVGGWYASYKNAYLLYKKYTTKVSC